MERLTLAEERILRLRAQGMTRNAAAASLGISERTAKDHMASIFRKLGVDNIVSALVARGWIKVTGSVPVVRPAEPVTLDYYEPEARP